MNLKKNNVNEYIFSFDGIKSPLFKTLFPDGILYDNNSQFYTDFLIFL